MGVSRITTYQDALGALKILMDHGYAAMLAGGCVRDRLLGVNPKDYDIASNAHPNNVIDLFSKKGLPVIPTGVEHGTVTVMMPSGPVEITTLRRDVETDGRHAIVEFSGADFRTDAARRDFTINSMYEDVNGNIHDFYSGRDDLISKKLRFVGDPTTRIREDYLRILRFFRFWSRLGFSPDSSALDAIEKNVEGLRHISQERITSEFLKILAADYSLEPISAMYKLNVMQIIFKTAIPIDPLLVQLLTKSSQLQKPLKLWLSFCLLLGIGHGISRDKRWLSKLTKSFKFSDKESQIVNDLFSGWNEMSTLKRDIATALDLAEKIEAHHHKLKIDHFFGPIWQFLAVHSTNNLIIKNVEWMLETDRQYIARRQGSMPINGDDILEQFPNLVGVQIGTLLASLKTSFRNGEWENRQEGLTYAKKLMNSDPKTI